MMRRLGKLLRHPLVVVPVLAAGLLFGWRLYLASASTLPNVPQNLLPGGNFDQLDPETHLPAGWRTNATGRLVHHSQATGGYADDKALAVQVSEYIDGSLQLETPLVSIDPQRAYLYKGYLAADLDVDILTRYLYKDGHSRLVFHHRYEGEADHWSTAAVAFKTDDAASAVQIVYRISGNGTIKLDNTYLVAKADGVYIAPQRSATPSLIPNGTLTKTASKQPQDWLKFRSGDNQAGFSYHPESPPAYVQTNVSDYKTGEAKWQYRPQAVKPHQFFAFSVRYRSTAPVDLVAEYELADQTRQFVTLDTLMPASEWTEVPATLEAPIKAQTLFVALVLHSNGTVESTDYRLADITQSHPLTFARPLVSLTFDDGWSSAYQHGARLLDELGYKGTFYINPTTLSTTQFMTSAQVQDLHQRGHQLASHAMNHIDLTTISAARVDAQLRETADYVRRLTGAAKIDFASPYGASDPEVDWYIRRYNSSHRTTESGVNTRQNFDPYHLRIVYIDRNTPISKLIDALSEAKTYNAWLIFSYHRIEDPTAETQSSSIIVSPATFTSQLEAIRASGIPVKTVAGALDELEGQLK